MSDHFDIAIIGAGIAGASVAALLPANMRVLLIEAEDHPGYHTTGRSNAFWQASYGGPKVEPLTTASLNFLLRPPVEFAESGFLRRRGALNIARATQSQLIEEFIGSYDATSIKMERVGRDALERHIPGIRPEWSAGVFEQECYDIDVAGLHAAYLRKAYQQGVILHCRTRIDTLDFDGKRWSLSAGVDKFSADVIVNAAGAWADRLAEMAGLAPVGITPLRRTLCQVRVSADVPAEMPLIIDINGDVYFRPESGRLWLSPHDETPSVPCDAQPEEIDVALAIARLAEVTDWTVERVEHRWAGLRSFTPDRAPVYGFDRANPKFFWCAGQGGFGIQTAPAAAQLCAKLLTNGEGSDGLTGVKAEAYSANRFRAASEAN